MNNQNSLSNKETMNVINKNEFSNNGNNNNLKTSNRCNSSYDKSIQQSPKIGTGKYRPLSSRQKPFSLIDFDDKKILSKTPNMPFQYNRLNEKELSHFIGNTIEKAGDNINKKMLIQNYLKEDNNNKQLKVKKNNETISDKKKQNDNNNNNNKLKTNKHLTIDTKESYIFNKDKKINKNEKNLKNNQNEVQESTINKKNIKRPLSAQIRQKKDRWLPKGYPHYEYCILNPKIFQENLKKNPFIKIEQIHNIKEIKQKSNQSDIFFLGPQSEKETKLLILDNNQKSKNYNVKLGSDIFNIKNDFSNLMKSSETYLFKNNNYPISSESKSFWTPRANIPTYMNYPSVEYNIINPKIKCNTKTKEQIYNECNQKKNDEFKNVINYKNPIFRQNTISNFYDITKGGMNRNFAYEKIYQDNPRSYYRKNDICTLHYNLFKNYGGIIDNPFRTQINKKIQV